LDCCIRNKQNGLVLCCLAFLVTSPSLSVAQEGFGRFGYTKAPAFPGLEVNHSGFKTRYSGSDRFAFASPLKIWNPVTTSPWRQVVLTDGGTGKPSKIRFDLWDCGVSMYFPAGIDLKIQSTASPFLSWKDGSVRDGIPTPKTNWICLSFSDQQPPVIFGFPEAQTALEISGELGNWRVKSAKAYKGWVRIALPFGLEPFRSTTVQGLGKVSLRCTKEEDLWSAPIADLPDPILEDDSDGITATWQLPRKRSVVPNSFYLSPLGGYPCRILSEVSTYPSSTEEGPIVLTKNSELVVRFPIKRIPSGRGLSIGEPIPQSFSLANWSNPLSIVDLALANTLSGRNHQASQKARDLLSQYFDFSVAEAEPNTKQTVFYKANGSGMLEAAVHSLLGQSVRTGESNATTEDPQMISIFWRLDPYSGSLRIPGEDATRVAALAAVAGSFSPLPSMRLKAAMFQASLSGTRGLNTWKRRVGLISTEPKLREPLLSIRKGLFSLNVQVPQSPVISNWMSELRCYGDAPMWLQKQAEGYEFCWMAPEKLMGSFSLESSYPIQVTNRRNIQSLYVSQKIGSSELRFEPEEPGQCSANLLVPAWADPFPLTVLPPEYSEPII
jgi:hypothetical protein